MRYISSFNSICSSDFALLKSRSIIFFKVTCYDTRVMGIHLQGFINMSGRKQAWVRHWQTGI